MTTLRVTYYALRDVRVGDEVRQAGDLVPEAIFWPYLSGYVSDGKLAPVLIATLPEDQQLMLLEWWDEVMGTTADVIDEPTPVVVTEVVQEDKPAAKRRGRPPKVKEPA